MNELSQCGILERVTKSGTDMYDLGGYEMNEFIREHEEYTS